MPASFFGSAEGGRDILDCSRLRRLESDVAEMLAKEGLVEIKTPIFEYYDLFTQTGSPIKQESMYKLTGSDGRILVLRPDTTTPVARLASMRLRDRPLKLFYIQPVFRAGGREILQAGVEWIGGGGDVELIALAASLLKGLGLEGARIEIGHAAILRELGIENEETHEFLARKNFSAFQDYLENRLGVSEARRITSLLSLYGKKDAIDEAKALMPGLSALNELEALSERLDMDVDMGLVGDMGYYTGAVFRGYAPGVPGAIISGGRYDNLMKTLGQEESALGFAVDLTAIAENCFGK